MEDWYGCIYDPGVKKRFADAVRQYGPCIGDATSIAICTGHRTVGVFEGQPGMSIDMHNAFFADGNTPIVPENN